MNKRIDDLKKNFINTLNHDLKTPVLAQMRSLSLLLDGMFGSLSPEQEEIIKLTKESCEAILDMVSTTLLNYKFENNEAVINYELVNLQEIIEECCKDLDRGFKEKNLKISLYPSCGYSFIQGDRELLKMAVSNIIANSITYAYRNSEMCIKIRNTGLNICISIINKGRQLSDEMLGSLFDYYALNSSKNTKIGFGIKLYLALQIVKAHLGGIVVRNNMHDEVVFDIILPNSVKGSAVIPIARNIMISENMSA